MQADTKGNIYEGLLEKSAKESPKGPALACYLWAVLHASRTDQSDRRLRRADSRRHRGDPACGIGGFDLHCSSADLRRLTA